MNFKLQIQSYKLKIFAIIILSTLVVVIRLLITGGPFDKVWAEDGSVFYHDAIFHGSYSLFYTYSGYASFLPRLLALFGTVFSPISYGIYCVLASATFTGMLSGYVAHKAYSFGLKSIPAFFSATIICLAPSLRVESLGNLANLPWILIYATWWSHLTFDTTDSLTSKSISRCLTFISLLTSPITLLLFPIIYLQNKKIYKNKVNSTIFLLGLFFLFLLIIFGHQSGTGVIRQNGFTFGIIRELVWGASGNLSLSRGVCILLAVIYITFLTLLSFKTPKGSAKSSIIFGIVVILILSYITGWASARYVSFGSFFIVCGICLGYEQYSPLVKKTLVSFLIIFIGLGFSASGARLSGPSWVNQIRSAHLVLCNDNVTHYKMYVSPFTSRNNKVIPFGSFVMPCR